MSGKDPRKIFLFLLLMLVLQGCSPTTESNAIKNINANRAEQKSAATTDNSFTNSKTSDNTVSTSSANSAVNNSQTPQAVEQKPRVTAGANDLSVFTLIRSKLSSDKELLNSVIIEVKNGNVVLSGKVSNEEQKKKAQDFAKSVQGVKGVKNTLTVAP